MACAMMADRDPVTRIAEKGQDAAAAATENDQHSNRIDTVASDLKDKVQQFRV